MYYYIEKVQESEAMMLN